MLASKLIFLLNSPLLLARRSIISLPWDSITFIPWGYIKVAVSHFVPGQLVPEFFQVPTRPHLTRSHTKLFPGQLVPMYPTCSLANSFHSQLVPWPTRSLANLFSSQLVLWPCLVLKLVNRKTQCLCRKAPCRG